MERYSDSNSFKLKLNNGYVFRNMFEYLKLTNTKGNFIFTKDSIVYNQIDTGIKILNNIYIDTSKTTEYFYDCDEDSFKIGFNIIDIRCITKLINKNDSLVIYKNKNENFMHVDILHSNSNKTSQNTVLIRYLDDILLEEPEYSEECFKVNVKASEFSKMCSNMSSMKCDNIKLEMYKTGIKCVGSTFNISHHEEILGTLYEKETTKTIAPDGKKIIISKSKMNSVIDTIYMRLKTIKSISKLSSIGNKTTLQFFIQSGLPLKINTSVGDFGYINVYIKSEDIEK